MNPSARPSRHRRLLTAVFGLAAAGLAPWIVVLGVIQPQRGTAVNNDGLRAAVLVLVVVLSAGAVLHSRTGPLSGTAAATLAALGAWFYGVTSTTAPTPLKTIGVAGLLMTAALAGWLGLATHRDHGRERRSSRWLSRVLLASAAIGVVIMVARPMSITPSTAVVDDLKVAWVGLDIAELVSLSLLAMALHRRSTWTVPLATTTAALLSMDALVNIVPASGQDRLIALAMALVELPLAGLALLVAVVLNGRGHLLDERTSGHRSEPVAR